VGLKGFLVLFKAGRD